MFRSFMMTVTSLAMLGLTANAQQAPGGGSEITSPEIHADHTVTFRLAAPQAREVLLSGKWMPAEGWIPGTMDGTFEETFTDIMKFVESNYRVRAEKAHRAVAGLSMGGFHSLHISKYYPDTFDYIGLFSAAILPNRNPNSTVYQDMDGTLRRQMENGFKLYWIGIGRSDFLYQNNVQYKEKLETMGMPHVFVESDGGHIWKNWRAYLTAFIPQLFQ